MNNGVSLTSPEVASLWSQYMNDSMDVCIKKNVLANAKDPDIISVFEFAMDISVNHLEKNKIFLEAEHHPIPIAFSERDVNPKHPALFTELFWLSYLHHMSVYGLEAYSLSFSSSTREDLRGYYKSCMLESIDLYNKTLSIMTKLNAFSTLPFLPPSNSVKFVEKQSYMGGLLGKKRPLNSLEVSHISTNLTKTSLKKTIAMAFGSVCKDKECKKFFERLIETASSNVKNFHAILEEDDIPSSRSLEDQILPCEEAPFSDKLMMFHSLMLLSISIAYYGTALSASMRKDLGAQYLATIAKNLIVVESGADLMIEKSWLEQPPQKNN